MKKSASLNDRHIEQYSKLVAEAVRRGVSMDDIITATRRYHGKPFAERVRTMVSDIM